MGSTEFYGMAYFDWGDALDAPLNVRKEIERFVLIDRQLYGMFNVFGNGIITGWTITATTDLQVSIEPGIAIINSYAVETDFADSIANLPPNTSGYVYAIIDSSTVVDKIVKFVFSRTARIDVESLLLATVTTGASSVSTIDNDVRTLVSFKQIIAQQIAAHRHTGSPPKIDLTEEVQGELPMDRMADLDAAKITTGRLPTKVMPQIDHVNLKNAGQLSHAQLDSIANSVTNSNVELFGEVTTINLLKMMCYLKYLDADVDKYFENTLLLLPGISPDNYIDWTASNANIDKATNCISGLPVFPSEVYGEVGDPDEFNQSLQLITVPWTTDADWETASTVSNLVISDGVQIAVNTTAASMVETFDTGISGKTVATFTPTLTETNTTEVTYDQTSVEGPLSAEFSTVNSRTAQFKRTFTQPQSWAAYDTLNIYVKSDVASHAAVSLIIYGADSEELATFLVLSADETTSSYTETNGFALKSFSIEGIVPRDEIYAIEFTTDEITESSESFSIDTIYLTSREALLPQGTMRLRYNTTSPVIFNAVEFTSDVPSGTDLRIRVRVANSLEGLATATFSEMLNSGEEFSLAGTHIEIDITFLADALLRSSPTLTALYLTIMVPAEEAGLDIRTAAAWQRGTLENITVNEDGVVSMENTAVGNYYFATGTYVNELNPDGIPEGGAIGDTLPTAPYQGYATLDEDAQIPDEYNPGREFLSGLYHPMSVQRLISGNFLIADTGNDRVIEVTNDGTFIRGYGSHNGTYSTELYALTACYNPRMGVLFITFSMDLDVKFIDLTKITIYVGARDMRLSNTADRVRDVTTGNIITRPDLQAFLDGSSGTFTGQTDNTVSIILDAEKRAVLDDATNGDVTIRITGNPSPGTSATVPPFAASGINCFVGDFTYFGRGSIWRPTCAIVSESDRYVVCNSRINDDQDTIAPSTVISIIEFQQGTGDDFDGQSITLTFSYSGMVFSDIVVGSVFYYTQQTSEGETERKLLVAALEMLNSDTSTSSSSSGSPTESQKLSDTVGKVVILSMDSNLITFSYTSPDGSYPSDAQFDEDGNIIIAETSLERGAGRIVTVDGSGTVINLIENGMFTKVWDVREISDRHLFVST